MIRYGSVCSGVGSCKLATSALGWECAFFSEIEAFPSAVLAHRFPEVPNLGDFTQIGSEHGPVDVLVGGTPCQSFSVAGKRAGLDSPNGNLAIEFARLAQRLRARWIVWENVPGVFSSWSDEGDGIESSDFDTFLGVLEDVGYSTSWTVLDAQHFGVPQRRRRVIVVGYLGDWRPPAAVLFDSESLSGNTAPVGEARENVAGTFGGGTAGGGPKSDTDRMTFVPMTAGCLQERDAKGVDSNTKPGHLIPWVSHTLDAHSHGAATEDGTGRGAPLVPWVPELADPICANEARTTSNAGNNPRPRNVVAYQCQGSNVGEMGTLRSGNGNTSGGVPFVPLAFTCKQDGTDADSVAPTLTAMEHDGSHANGGGQVAVAFKASHFTRGKDGAPSDLAPPLSADADSGDQDTLVLSIAENQRGEVRTSDVIPALGGGGKPGEGYPAIAFQPRVARNGRGAPDTVASALTGEAGRTGKGDSAQCVVQALQVRRLAPSECEALMGLPRGWTLVPYKGKPASDSPRYRAIGNGWAVPVFEWVFGRLDAVERLTASGHRED